MWHKTLAFNIWCTKTNPTIHNWCTVCDFQVPKLLHTNFGIALIHGLGLACSSTNWIFHLTLTSNGKALKWNIAFLNNHLLKCCANLTPSRCYEMSLCNTCMNWKEWPFLKGQQMEWLLVSKTYFGRTPYWPSKMPLKRLVRNLWPSKTF